MILEIQNIELSFKENQILHSLSLSIAQGDIVCLAGRNGAGKTSLLRCIVGLEKVTKGSIAVLGEKFNKKLLNKLGIMIGGVSLYSYLTGKENLDIIRRYYNLDKQSVIDTLDLFNLREAGDKLVKYYSDGMKQRLAIGMAFIHRPQFVILDEPLNTLDPEAIVEIRQLIKRLNKEFGTTFLITSHSLEEIGKIFTQLVILKQGKKILDAKRDILDTYHIIETSLAENSDLLIKSIKEMGLFYKSSDDNKISILGSMSDLEYIKNIYPNIQYIAPSKASIEDIYLFANFQ